jgi:hypothetical protein
MCRPTFVEKLLKTLQRQLSLVQFVCAFFSGTEHAELELVLARY